MPGLYPGRLTWEIVPREGYFSLRTQDEPFFQLKNVRLKIYFQWNGKSHLWAPQNFRSVPTLNDPPDLPGVDSEIIETLVASFPPAGLQAILVLAQANHGYWALWHLSLHNQGREPIWIDQIRLLDLGNDNPKRQFILGSSPQDLRFYLNGWQSWSYTAALSATSTMPRSRLGPFQNPMVVNPGTPLFRQSGHFSSDFFTVLFSPKDNLGLVAGFLSQQHHFGSLAFSITPQPHLQVWANGDHTRLDPGKSMETDWFMLYPFTTDHELPLSPYLEAVASFHQIEQFPSSPRGWCSWYYYYTKLSAEDIFQNLRQIQAWQTQLPLELVQIDDGFETQVGDWTTFKASFPQGVAPLAQEIKGAGLRPGLWLAPFIVHPRSQLARQHPEWLLRRSSGRPVNAGFVWNTFATALDLTVPEALDYAAQIIDTAVHKWGFPYLKLDFLYAAALPGRYRNPTLTRAQVLRRGMETLRQAAGDETFLLGCGAPLGSVLGLVNATRIGADISGSWQPEYLGHRWFFRGEPHMPAAVNAIRNTLTRAPLHRRWWINDPDCLILGPTKLSLAEVQTLASVIALSGGSFLISDNLTTLPPERLKIAQVLLPLIEASPEVIDLLENEYPAHLRLDLKGALGEWHLLAFINWDDQPITPEFTHQRYHLDPQQTYLVHDFWNDRHYEWKDNSSLTLPLLPPHGIALLAAYPFRSEQPAWVGSTLHISQGLEVKTWEVETSFLTCRIDIHHEAEGNAYFYLPLSPWQVRLDETPLQGRKILPHIYGFPVRLSTSGVTLTMAW
ncbi:MAG: glycoside hydrolase family 36 protein [Thermanaerothrix sp.]|uniref:glycoside hydrolase family 36 protein n=1 Tax=Thermanaerothrix sp. TaxID=2972675 RepID=UPI003C7DC0D0